MQCLHTKKVSFEADYQQGKIYEQGNDEQKKTEDERIIKNNIQIMDVQCFPLYSILLAVGRTQVDYFSLDIEGAESQVLANVPWPLVDVKVNPFSII